MVNSEFSYCVAIRTLGKAGEMYQKELDSLARQTIPPKKILVYIAEGYDIPSETIGAEQYIVVPKGMVAQRALPYDEVDTEFVLLLDDDVYIPPDGAEKMLNAIRDNNADCIAIDLFCNQDMTSISKIKAFATNLVTPRRDDSWAFKIKRNGAFSYNNSPSKEFYQSQSAAGPASLWKKSSLSYIKFEEEKWIGQFPFAYGEDMLFFYKLYLNGRKLLVYYNSGALHLDAQTARKSYGENSNKLLIRAQLQFILWWRTSYDIAHYNGFEKLLRVISFTYRLLQGFTLHILYSICLFRLIPLTAFLKGNIRGLRYVRSKSYKSVPNFIISER